MPKEYYIFICHATEDKDEIVEKLVNELKKSNLDFNIFYDDYEIIFGEEIDKKIQVALNKTKYAVTIISHNFLKKPYPLIELGAIINKKYNGKLKSIIPIYYKISTKTVNEHLPIINKYKSIININDSDNIENPTLKIIQAINFYENKGSRFTINFKKAAKIVAILVVILILFSLINPIKNYFKGTDNIDSTNISIGKTEKSNDSIEITPSITKKVRPNNIEDNNANINTSFVNSKDNIEVSVTIINSSNMIEDDISESIADIYSNAGMKGNTGFLFGNFITKPAFKDLSEGNHTIIEKMKLINYTDYLVIGKISYDYTQDEFIKGKTYCTVSINMKIISIINERTKSAFTVSANGNGFSREQARNYALKDLLDNYKNEYSSF